MTVVEQDTSWMEDAACAGVDSDLFFPELGGSGIGTKAKEVCAECPVRQECLDYALSHDEKWGIWGGTNRQERRHIRRGRSMRGAA